MSGTNTICVVTTLLETGMVAVAEPVTELTLETPAGLVGVDGARARRQAAPASSSATCRRSPCISTRRSRCRTSARSRSTSAGAACSTCSPTPRQLGFALTPDEGADIVARHRDDQGGAREQLPGVVHPENPGHPRHHDRPALRPRRTPAMSRPQRRDGLDRAARLGPAGHLDGRDRPLAVRHRHLRRDGGAARQGPARGWTRRSCTRASSARSSRAGWWRRRPSAAAPRWCRRSPARRGSPASRSYVLDPDRPVPGGVHGG